MKIVVEEWGFLVTELRPFGRRTSRFVRLMDIAAIAAEKVGKITYDEVFLIVQEASGEGLALGELDEGFADLERALREQLIDYSYDWWTALQEGPIGARLQVWPGSKT